MLFNLLTSLIDQYSFLNVFKYLTFRTGLSVVTSLIIVFIIGGPLIKLFSEKMITGPIRQDGPIDHIIKKSGTPTMGGVIIIIGIISRGRGKTSHMHRNVRRAVHIRGETQSEGETDSGATGVQDVVPCTVAAWEEIRR